jgi:hypothetical protein
MKECKIFRDFIKNTNDIAKEIFRVSDSDDM